MIALIAFSSLLLLSQDPNLGKIIPKWTGANGYEEYVRAAMILSQPRVRALEGYVSAREAGSTDAAPPEGINPKLTLLELYRLQTSTASPALDLILAGNQKAVRYPVEKMTAITLMPELPSMKQAGKLLARQAYVKLADGDSSGATTCLLNALTLGRKLQNGGGNIHLLVGEAIHGFAYRMFDGHRDQFSTRDLQRIRSWIKADDGNLRANAIHASETERASIRNTFDDFFTNPDAYVEPADLDKIKAAIQKIPPQKRDELYTTVFKRIEWPFPALIQQFRQPEHEWLKPLEYEPPVDNSPVPDLPQGSLAVELKLLQLYSMLGAGDYNGRFGSVIARFAVQERLLDLTAAVLEYRWKKGELPATLRAVTGKEFIDPASRLPYDYRVNGSDFEIKCELPDVGVVTLAGVSEPGPSEPLPPLP